MRDRERWYASDDPGRVARGAGWRIGVVVLVLIAVSAVIGAVAWGVGVATSDVHGKGQATRQINDVDNRLFAQTNFVQLYNDVQSYDQRLDQAARDKASHAGAPDASFWDTNYTGLVNQCISTRNDYNAAAKKITQAKFRDAGLPDELDPTDPRFDCKESADAIPTSGGTK